MNRFGPFLRPFWWFKAYWAGVGAALRRAQQPVLGPRSGDGRRVACPAGAACALGRPQRRGRWRRRLALDRSAVGGFIFYNTNVLNEYRTSHDEERASADYERFYKQYEHSAAAAHRGRARRRRSLSRASRTLAVRGEYRLANRTATADRRRSTCAFRPRPTFARRSSAARRRRTHADDDRGYYIYTLDHAAGARRGRCSSISISRTISRGFENNGHQHAGRRERHVRQQPAICPRFGYDARGELSEDATRRKYGLAAEGAHAVAGRRGGAPEQLHLRSTRTGWTSRRRSAPSPDQIALAPGYLQREWTEGGRRYFHYKMDAPILNFFSFLSARYAGEARSLAGTVRRGRRDRDLLPPGARVQRRPHDRRGEEVARLLHGELRPVPAPAGAHPRVPALRELRAVVPQHHPVLGVDRLHRARRERRRRRLPVLRDRARGGAPVVGAPGDRRQRAGRDRAVRDAVAVLGAAW